MYSIIITAFLASGCVFISEDEYAQRMHQSGSGTSTTPCVESTWWTDADGDGFGDPDSSEEACEQPEGTADNGDDCDDSDAIKTPETIWYTDADGDGFGGESTQVMGCDAPAGAVANSQDCNDANSEVHPDADEDCMTPVDDDCTGTSNDPDALGCEQWFADLDEDGFSGDDALCLCEAEAPYTGVNSKDCDDSDASVSPDAEEVCGNGVDDDCDGTAGACGLTGRQSLSEADVIIEGASVEARYGTTIAGGGDLTGDGVADALISSYHWSSLKGRVSLVAGPLTEDTTTADLVSWEGVDSVQKLGMSIAMVGDTNGDGAEDMIIGSPQSNGGASWSGGIAYVMMGPIDPDSAGSLLDDADAVIQGGSSGRYLGRHVSGVGDFNGDDLDDVIVSVHGSNQAALVLGPLAGTHSVSDVDTVDVRFDGPSSTETGIDTIGLGDVDGDGLGDVLIAARTGGASTEGKIFLVYGHEAPESDIDLLTSADVVLTGVNYGDQAGEQLTRGDVDGDGLADLIIGAPEADGGSAEAGEVYVLTAPEDGTISLASGAYLTLSGERAGGNMGEGLAYIEGADGADGRYLAVGAPQSSSGAGESGEVFIFDASVSGVLMASDAIGELSGTVGYGEAGAAVENVGDLDNDGIPDLMVGQPVTSMTATNGGAVFLFAGGAL